MVINVRLCTPYHTQDSVQNVFARLCGDDHVDLYVVESVALRLSVVLSVAEATPLFLVGADKTNNVARKGTELYACVREREKERGLSGGLLCTDGKIHHGLPGSYTCSIGF